MQKPLFRGVRPHIEDLGQYTLRPEVQMALALTFKIRQQHNGEVMVAPQLDMARSLHWLLCLIHKGRGLERAYTRLCGDYRSWHLRTYKKRRHTTFYQGRIKGMLAVLGLFEIIEGEIMSKGGGRTLPHLSLRLLNPDRIWGLYLPEPLRVRMISGAEVRAAWGAYSAAHQLLLAGSQRGLAWARKHLAKTEEETMGLSKEPVERHEAPTEPPPPPAPPADLEEIKRLLLRLCAHLGA